ncbi:MAG: zinc-binding alcohol dehydrogenase family protein [Solirubrobacteraceae bacterium]|nr:zinc-binding alcohol dehydrogenase family protein [Solirubrobacteraceae bacterium]
MRAALIESYGQTPSITDVDEPRGEGPRGTVIAAGINPVDRTISGGEFYALRPKPPYTPGMEGVARQDDGSLVYFGRPGDLRHGSLGEQVILDPAQCFALPDGTDPGQAIACGIAGLAAWMSIKLRGGLQPGERVAVTGATGVGGRMALQIAKLLGAEHVVAIGRNQAALDAVAKYADDVVCVAGPSFVYEKQLQQLGGHDLTIDFTWGTLAMAALNGQRKHGRLVQVGSASGPGLGLAAPPMRGNAWSILGFSIFNYDLDEQHAEYRELLDHVSAGRIEVPVHEIGLDDVPAAWEAQGAGSPHAKTVVTLG